MRVLQISDSLKQRFGVTSFLMNYNQFIDKKRIIFDYLIIDSEKEIIDKINSFGGKIFYMPKLNFFNFISFIKTIKNFFKRNKYSVVHSHFYQIDFIVKPIAFKYGVKHYISHSHNTKYSDFVLRSIRNYFMAIPIKYSSSDFCACSEKASSFLFGRYILKLRNKNTVIIPNAIDYNKYTFNIKIRNELINKYNTNGNYIFGTVGSLKKQKNHEFIIDVFNLIHKKNINTKLVIVGDGYLRSNLEEKVKNNKLENDVLFIGSTEKAFEYYNLFDCFIMPSLYEGFGLALLEAEINGLPCIISDNIPNEAIISKNVFSLSLYNNISDWLDLCESVMSIKRANIDNYKYDIRKASEFLMNYYEGLI